jgi:cytochrome bd-type quinol oxidase subunit 1
MNYPVWQLDFAGGGLLIATIAILHVYIAHFAVGGGLFLVLTELKARREKSTVLMEYLRQHTKFFLLLTLVLGGTTGIGIWFTISVLNPTATSTLIHLFVFAWAIEWLFFVGEIVSILIYYYAFDRLSPRQHLLIGWLYFAFAWLSLFVINGIVAFMLTPGGWLANGSFWAALFNPTFWPALFFRTFLALIIAGLFGFVTATRVRDPEARLSLVRYSAKWLLAPFLLYLASAFWYRGALSSELDERIFFLMPNIPPALDLFLVTSPLLVLGGIIMAIRQPARLNQGLAAIMLVIGILHLGAFEFIREGGRKPYIIGQHLYANSIRHDQLDQVSAQGILQSARWVEHREITPANQRAAGREVYNLLCLSCHSLNGPMKDIRARTVNLAPGELELIISTMGRVRSYMPPFVGTEAEKQVLVAFIKTL